MFFYRKNTGLALVLLLIATMLSAQYPASVELTLEDGTEVHLCRGRSKSVPIPVYYYWPVNFRISKVNERSEFSFLVFRQDSLSPITSGLLHMLVVWGLDKAQFQETESLLQARTDSTAVLAGSIMLKEDEAHPQLEILSEGKGAEILRRSVRNQTRVPLHAGSKLAIAFSFSEQDARQMHRLMNNEEQLESIRFRVYFKPDHQGYNACRAQKYWLDGNLKTWLQQLK